MLQRRQGYGAVSGSLSKGASAVDSSVSSTTSGLSQGQVIGVVLAAILFLVLLIATTWCCCVRSARRRDARKIGEAEAASELGEDETSRSVSNKHRTLPMTRQDAISTLPMTQLERQYDQRQQQPVYESYAPEQTSRYSQHGHHSHHHHDDMARSQQDLLPHHPPPSYHEDLNPFSGALRREH